MFAISDGDVPPTVPPIDDLVVDRPQAWFGKPLQWLSPGKPVPVFLTWFDIKPDQVGGVYLFAARYEVSDVLVQGKSWGWGRFMEYFAVSKEEQDWRVRRLTQRGRSVTYSETAEPNDVVAAKKMMARASSLHRQLPRWENPTEAWWPLDEGKPMQFVGQLTLADTPVTRAHLTWDVSVYLFASRLRGEAHFKVLEQRVGVQSAEEHYASEE